MSTMVCYNGNMKESFRKVSVLNLLVIFLVGGSCFGLIQYFEYRIGIEANKLAYIENANQKLSNEVKKMEAMIKGDVANVLSQEQQKNEDLKNTFNGIKDTVDVLKRLSVIDVELLKKYSKAYFLNEHYVPISLTDVEPDYRISKSTNYQIESDVWPYLKEMIEVAVSDGMELRVLSGYRSFSTQAILKSNYKVTYGAGTANKFSADQGYSEHQLGTAVDFSTIKTKGVLDGFDKTPEYKWLKENAYKYGFVISYPVGNTYYKYEPWHWRFVGVALATKLNEQNMYFYDMDQRAIDTYLSKIFE